MLVLALDTATTRITVGVVEVGTDGGVRTLARVDGEGARAHAELLAPGIERALDTAGAARGDLDAVVCGLGPGPFTGLRVGLVTAAAIGDGLGRPVHGVATHEALLRDAAAQAGPGSARLAVTDARRREVYWALAVGGPGDRETVVGPAVDAPDVLVERLAAEPAVRDAGGVPVVGDAAAALAEAGPGLGLAVVDHPGPTPAALVTVAGPALAAGAEAGPLVPLYLRRPDAVPPGAPKAVRR